VRSLKTGIATATAAEQTVDAARSPYPPGWPHLLLRAVERLPGPTWIVSVALGLIVALVTHLPGWWRGDAPVGTLDPTSSYWGLLAGSLLWVLGYLERVASRAFDAVRPALSPSVGDPERLRYELTTAPRIPSLAAALLATLLTVATLVSDPASSDVDRVPGPLFVAVLMAQAFMVSLLFVVLYQLIRQMRLIRRTLDRHVVVDIFRPGPLHAFPRLMATSGASLVLLAAPSVVPTVQTAGGNVLAWAPYVLLPPVIAVIAFIVPLYGTHQRLAAEKERLADEAEERLRGLLREINRDIDARDLGGLDPLDRALASVMRQREIVAKLSTWPWSAGTARGFASAILLPLGLYLVQRLLSQLV